MTGLDAIWVLRGVEGLTLAVGALIAFASLRAYARAHETALLLLGVGFVIVTVASALAGVLYEVTTHDLLTAWTVSACVDLVGFSLILYSIVRPRSAPPPAAPSDDPTEPPGS